jgi:hypothetical protein
MPWLKLTWGILWLYTLLTVLVLFFRPDFINLTVCTVALYMMFNTDRITRMRFRALVLGIIITLIYDCFWFWMKFKSYSEDNPKDLRSNEIHVRRFSLMMSIASFILRVSNGNFLCNKFRFSWLSFFGRIQWISERLFNIKKKLCLSKNSQRFSSRIKEYF